MTTTDQQAIAEMAKTIGNLVASHWNEIKDVGDADEKSIARVGITAVFSFAKEIPVGVINLSFAARVKDSATFSGEQLKLKGVEA